MATVQPGLMKEISTELEKRMGGQKQMKQVQVCPATCTQLKYFADF
jgi:hypothetical protein